MTVSGNERLLKKDYSPLFLVEKLSMDLIIRNDGSIYIVSKIADPKYHVR